MSCLGTRVARRRRRPVDREARALVEPELGAARGERAAGDRLPARGRSLLEVGIDEEAVDPHRPEPLGRMENEDRHVFAQKHR